ncbi:hypothetical protein ANCCEY_13533 [Ancylostoma ceylanicum]|uniref:Uncharacterized protein n=1 Tax=Ancylostoma ceylanicum TaxID=53326 RepID=A0A0D6L6T4_9BILA|nr:hypothetical protein ANCCEY_13533 [Ancylostoma ceylanicum]
MSAQLSSHKRLLTQFTKKVETVLTRFIAENLESLTASDDDSSLAYNKDCRRRLEEAIGAIEACTSRITQLLKGYASLLDSLKNPSKKDYDDYDEYAAKVEEVLSSALDYLVLIEARDAHAAVNKFQITPENHEKAPNFLKAKYGNSEELVNRLIDKIDRINSRSTSLKDQRTLFEELQVIVSQLRQKGEHVDSQWLQKQVLSNFTEQIQRKVLEKNHAMTTDSSFSMDTLLKYLEDVISSEEMVALYTRKKPDQNQTTPRSEKT